MISICTPTASLYSIISTFAGEQRTTCHKRVSRMTARTTTGSRYVADLTPHDMPRAWTTSSQSSAAMRLSSVSSLTESTDPACAKSPSVACAWDSEKKSSSCTPVLLLAKPSMGIPSSNGGDKQKESCRSGKSPWTNLWNEKTQSVISPGQSRIEQTEHLQELDILWCMRVHHQQKEFRVTARTKRDGR